MENLYVYAFWHSFSSTFLLTCIYCLSTNGIYNVDLRNV